MASTPWRELITSEPQVMQRAACIKGTRIPVSVVLDNLAGGLSEDQIVEQYPSLSHDAIHACLAYAAELAHDKVLRFQPRRVEGLKAKALGQLRIGFLGRCTSG